MYKSLWQSSVGSEHCTLRRKIPLCFQTVQSPVSHGFLCLCLKSLKVLWCNCCMVDMVTTHWIPRLNIEEIKMITWETKHGLHYYDKWVFWCIASLSFSPSQHTYTAPCCCFESLELEPCNVEKPPLDWNLTHGKEIPSNSLLWWKSHRCDAEFRRWG